MAVADHRERAGGTLDGPLGGNAASLRATARALAAAESAVAVVLVEGISDQVALETAAVGRGRDLAAERVVVVPIGGAHAIGNFLTRWGPPGSRVRLAGLCDLREKEIFRRALETAGVGSPRTRAELARFGFHVCVDDLEDELIRAVGVTGVEEVFDAHGDLRSFRAFQIQPAWRDRPPEAQLWRFLRSSSRRNLRYVRLLVEVAVRRDVLPGPLDGVLTTV
ncbi:TOPRIM nucleotidyl transferase/hydrolase domain-containing protein [Micromonospora cathayae]|uniref:ATP-dependent endonuclease n=1 Tax=Micromonospora cathayae TaxID=3028804 RepID=A0ABY7ZIG3_9ACTN|nr:TOPRIM nucleotidyl transferase/hydrolase domain-containing protein [Micromonospora sp. HUAS 3]WDZ82226.1 ATP-dependent endonuclease [Micromonospora sp. HUAS 3]